LLNVQVIFSVQDSLLLFRHDARILPGLGPQQGGLVGVACRRGGLELLNAEVSLATALAWELQLGQPLKLPDGRLTMEAKPGGKGTYD
jgi:hypothetical protein